ncbi:MAG TPA: hypothetical protein VG872_06645 [Acidimicrobiia bacterium]|jgi:hypothetical protein|nr:hypothetical protein [Acidimicrobiia bacterium]
MPLGLALGVGGLVAIAMLRGPVELDPDSPEGTVQEYLVALDEQRWDDAVAVIHPDWLGACDSADLASFTPEGFTAELGHEGAFGGGVTGMGEVIVDEGGEPLPEPDTFVDVTITHGGQGGLGSNWSEFVTFNLVDDGEFWWLVNDPWPYFVWNCRG